MAEDNNNFFRAFFNSSVFIEILVGFVVFSTYLFMNQIDALSVHLQHTFNVPIQGISIYLSKSHTARTLIIILTSLLQHLIITSFPGSIVPLTVISYLFLLLTRLIYLISLYHSPFLLKYYIINNIEAFFFGFFHVSFLSTIINHIPIALMSMTVSGTFTFILQKFINGYKDSSPLTMFKIHSWTCVFLSVISFAGLNSYLSYYHRFPPSYINTTDRVKSVIDRFNEVVSEIKENVNGLYLSYSMINRINGEIKGLMAEANRIRDIKGITYEADVIMNILRQIKDKIDQMLNVIDFGKKMGLTSVYELRVPLRTHLYQQLTRGRQLKDFWESLKTYFENVKHVYVFKFKEPIDYESSKYSKTDNKQQSAQKSKSQKEEKPEKKKAKAKKKRKMKAMEKDKEGERVTTPENREDYQDADDNDDDSDLTQEEEQTNTTEEQPKVTLEPTDQESQTISKEAVTRHEEIQSTQEPGTTDSETSTVAPGTPTRISESSEPTSDTSTLTSESSITSEISTLGFETDQTSMDAKTLKSEYDTPTTSENSTMESESSTMTSETESTSRDIDMSTSRSPTESTLRNVESSKGVQPTEAPKTSSSLKTSGPPTTQVETVMTVVTEKPRVLAQTASTSIKPPVQKFEKLVLKPQPYLIPEPKSEEPKDELALKIYQIQVDLNGLKEELIKANTALRPKDGNIKTKEEVKSIIHDVENQIIKMDTRFTEVERILNDKIKYEYHVATEGLKSINQIQPVQTRRMYEDKNVMKRVFLENKKQALSVLLMFFTSQFFKEFFFPRTMPLTFSQVPGTDMISVVTIVWMYGSILVLILDKMAVDFKNWNSGYNILWSTILPVVIISAYIMFGLHTTIQSVTGAFNSDGNVLLMTIFLLTFSRIMGLLSYIGVANFVYWQTANVLGNLHYFTLYHVSTLVYSFFISKLAIKPEARLALGYAFRTLPVQIHPGRGTFLFWLRDGLKSSTKELMGDLISNIRRYI